jgi:hypothetical protein
MPRAAKKIAKKSPPPGAARELKVQMKINHSNADAGDSGANIAASALISVLVTLDGAPVTDLGVNAGNGTGAVALPAGWSLVDGFNVRPGGCNASITEFLSVGSGIYDIRIVPFLGNNACSWLSGEYVYAVAIKVSRNIAGKKVFLQGSALAKLHVA